MSKTSKSTPTPNAGGRYIRDADTGKIAAVIEADIKSPKSPAQKIEKPANAKS